MLWVYCHSSLEYILYTVKRVVEVLRSAIPAKSFGFQTCLLWTLAPTKHEPEPPRTDPTPHMRDAHAAPMRKSRVDPPALSPGPRRLSYIL